MAIDRLVADARATATALRKEQIASAVTAVQTADAQVTRTSNELVARQGDADRAAAATAAGAAQVETWRSRISAFAADAFMRVGTARQDALARIRGGTTPKELSAADDARRTTIYADQAMAVARRERGAAERRLAAARSDQGAADDAVALARSALDAAAAGRASARAIESALRSAPIETGIDSTVAGLSARDGPTILGPALLGPDDMAAFVRARGLSDPSVDLGVLAATYVDEGNAEGVRADLAWAQSIIETGFFGFAGSMVRAGDNNFAGIGACDSCTSGFRYGTPQLGVRAQIQLLRTYADPKVTAKALSRPAVGKAPEQVGVRGCCSTWMALSGRWATGPQYGIKILTVYNQMLQFTADRRAAARTAAAQTPDAPVVIP